MARHRTVTRRQFISEPGAGLADREATDVGAAEPVAPADSPYLVRFARPAMATDFQLFLTAGRDEHAAEAALAALDAIEQVEAQLTVYRETSEVIEINRRAATEPVGVEPRLFALLERAMELHGETGGAYDISSGPLSRAWGFARRQGGIPGEDELAAARELVGSQYVELDRDRQMVHFTKPGVEINLNSIGKGYALDRCREVLTGFGVTDFLLHGGQSSVLAGGAAERNADGTVRRGWTVGIGHPLRPAKRLAELQIADRAVGTSGAGFQFFRHGGKRYGHILDPRSGVPAEGVFSVSVLAATAAEADALSTAFYVMGCEAAEEYCTTRPEIGFLMLLPSAGGGAVELVASNLDDDAWRLV